MQITLNYSAMVAKYTFGSHKKPLALIRVAKTKLATRLENKIFLEGK